MSKTEARKLPLGLYHLYWKGGGVSLAAVGMLNDGRRWFAPANWCSNSAPGIASTKWSMVHHAVQVVVEAPSND